MLLPLTAPALQADTDLLEQPSTASPLAQHALLLDLADTGSRLVAVGERGHILYSDDDGGQWQQASTPSIITLTAVYFPTADVGWAVGHDGLVLHSSDGGNSWTRQLDGFAANRLVIERFETLIAETEAALADVDAEADADEAERLQQRLDDLEYRLEEARIAGEEGATKPFLDLWFANEREGFIVGAYGLFFRTEDGGRSWSPWFEHIDNEFGYHYNAITEAGDSLLMAGEAGTLYRSDDTGRSWQALESPYEGSWFGLTGCDDSVLVYGLRGNLFRSGDRGDSWQQVPLENTATLTGGACGNEALVLTTAAGQVFESRDGGHSFSPLRDDHSPYSAAVLHDERLILVGLDGVRSLTQPDAEATP